MSLARVLPLALLLAACSEAPRCADRTSLTVCESNDACGSNQECVDGRCLQMCSSDDDCRGSNVCVDNHCITLVVECNAGKVPVCGSDPEQLYSTSGALLPVPDDSVEDGSCEGIMGPCRPRPTCERPGAAAMCANGAAPACVLGEVTKLPPRPTPMPDSGPMPMPDSGTPEDAGSAEDAGSDAGGSSDDAGADAGADAGS